MWIAKSGQTLTFLAFFINIFALSNLNKCTIIDIQRVIKKKLAVKDYLNASFELVWAKCIFSPFHTKSAQT